MAWAPFHSMCVSCGTPTLYARSFSSQCVFPLYIGLVWCLALPGCALVSIQKLVNRLLSRSLTSKVSNNRPSLPPFKHTAPKHALGTHPSALDKAGLMRQFKREVAVLNALSHPRCLRLKSVVASRTKVAKLMHLTNCCGPPRGQSSTHTNCLPLLRLSVLCCHRASTTWRPFGLNTSER